MALSAQNIRQSDTDPNLRYYPMAVVTAYQGGLAVLDGSGNVRPGYVATGLVAVGIFDFSGDVMEGTMNNSAGSAGDLNARVRAGTFRFTNYSSDPVVAADVGKPCFIVDDDQVAHSDGTATRSVAGTVIRRDSNFVWVQVGSVNGTSLAAEIAAREAVSVALALTTTPGGASLVGVFDTLNYFSTTTVEAVLAEIWGKLIKTTTPGGASYVGVFDTAGYFSGANVEAVLAEIWAKLILTTTPGGASYIGIYDTAAKFTAANVEAALAENIDARRVATTADTGVALIPVTLKMVKAGDTTGTTDLVLDATYGALEITGVTVVKTGTTGGTGDTVRLINGTSTNYITDAMSVASLAAGAIVRCASLDTTYQAVAAGATLRLSGVKGGSGASCACEVYISALRTV
jgi:hypothetical protein